MDDLQRAVAWLEDQSKYYSDKEAYQDDFKHCRTLLDALRDLEEDQRRGNQKIKEVSIAYGILQGENAQLKAKLDAVRAECNKPIMTTSDVFGGGIASGHNILKRNILAIIDKEADT